jgi:hypothetical protein
MTKKRGMGQTTRKVARKGDQKTAKKKQTSTIKNAIYRKMDGELESKTEKKKERGEVFTPMSLVDELCDAFPKQIWKNKTAKWLDPSVGIGTFMVAVFFRYMDGLKTVIPSNESRAKHIIENMLYMVEIDKENATECKKTFQALCPTATPQLYTGDFLTGTFPANWPKEFDVVIGNPPYNVGGTKREGTKRAHIPFTEKGLSLLTSTGYLGYICPPSYRETGSRMNELFKKGGGHFLFIHTLGPNETHKIFKVQGRVDLFLFQKRKTGSTHYVDEYGNKDTIRHLSLDRHIPNFGLAIFEKLFQAVEKHGKVEGIRTSEMTTVTQKGYNSKGRHRLLHLIVEEGRRVYRTKTAHSLESTPKCFINGLGLPYVYYDKKGEYGPTQTPIVVLRPSASTVRFLESPLFVFVAWGLRITGNNNLPYLLDAVPNLSSTSLADLYHKLHLTASEIKWITDTFPRYEYKDKDVIVT